MNFEKKNQIFIKVINKCLKVIIFSFSNIQKFETK